jgi:hypothetical protein
MSGYVPRITEIGRQTGLTDDEIKGRPLAGKHGHDECERGYCEPLAETANLKAHIQTLQGRLESLERTVTAMREREIKVRRGMGQLAAAYELHK